MALEIAVIGAGSWGTALSLVLARNGHNVHLWAKDEVSLAVMKSERENKRYLPGVTLPKNIHIEPSLAAAIQNTHEVLIVVPSHAFTEVLEHIKPHLKPDQGIAWATKGLDPQARFLHEVVETIAPNHPMALLTGPSFAKEVAVDLPTAVVVAHNQLEFGKRIQTLFQARHFRVYLSDDLLGAEIGGAIKNVLALAVGVAEGLGFHTNTKAALMTRGLAEMMRLGKALGAKRETLTGLSGLGDMILTCSDTQSRNLRFGMMLGQGLSVDVACKQIGQVVESIHTSDLVYQLSQRLRVRMPITDQVHAIVHRQKPLREALVKLLEPSQTEE